MMLRDRLTARLSMAEVHEICCLTQGADNDFMKKELFALTSDADDRVAVNALWVFTHFDLADNEWLYSWHDELIDRVLREHNALKECRKNTAGKGCAEHKRNGAGDMKMTIIRLMLSLLLRQPFVEEELRTDFIDFCLSQVTAASQPYAIRALCMKLAYEQCKHYPELLSELATALDMLSSEPLSPGLVSARRQVLHKIKRQKSIGKHKVL